MKKKTIILTIILSAFITITLSQNTHADDILKIANYKEIYNCYAQGKMKADVGNLQNGLRIEYIAENDGEDQAKLPNLYGNTIKDGDLSCRQLIAGYESGYLGSEQRWVGLFTTIGYKGVFSDRGSAKSFLKSLGYKSDGSADANSKHTYYEYKLERTSNLPSGGSDYPNIRTHEIVITNVKNGKFTSNSKASQTKNGNSDIVDFEIGNNGKTIQLDCALWKPTYGGCTKHTITDGGSWENFKNEIFDDLKDHRSTITMTYETENLTYRLLASTEADGDVATDEIMSNWVFDGGMEAAAKKAISKGGFNSVNEIYFTPDQKTSLHQFYIKTFYGGTVICKEDDEDAYNNLTTYESVDAKNIKSQTCRVKRTQHMTDSGEDVVNGAKKTSDENRWDWSRPYTFAELVDAMTEDELLGVASYVSPGDEDTESEERDPDCHTKAGALGWILCPIIDITSNMVEQTYTNMVQPYLSIDAALFDTSEKGGQTVREIWGLFQGFANLAFVVLFLVVIFSQLTGVGIDNYGIKKILPKLIIGAVLINMSYLICQLAVDLSNILGRAIADMFQQVADGINSDLATKSVNLYPGQASSVSGKFSGVGGDHGAGTILLVIVGIAGVFGIGAFLAAGPAIIIPVLLALISLAIGIFFLFALLALRQAIAVILVVVSPMAFAMYMLPNTKKIFDKWYQAFKGMLVAYPIASALVFGGDLVSKILLVADGSTEITSLGLLLSAAVVGVAPIFFIPSVIRKSMDAIAGLGNIANRMQTTAKNAARTPAQSYLDRSGLNDYKLRRQEAREAGASDRRMRKKGQIARNRLARLDGKDPDKMSPRQRVQYRQAVRDEAAYAKSEADLSSSYITSLGNDDLSARMAAGLAEGDMEKFGSAMDELGGRDQGELLAQLTTLSETDAWKNMDKRKKAAVAAKLRGQKGNPFAQAYGKLLAQEQAGNVRSFNTLAEKGKIQDKVKENGATNLASMDKDVYKWLNGDPSYKNAAGTDTKALARDSFRSDDLAEAMGQVSGAQQAQFAQFIATRGQQATDAKAVSDAQLANGGNAAIAAAYAGADSDQIKTAVDTGQVNDPTLKGNIQRTFHDQIENINANNELAGATNKGLADAAGIKAGPQQVVIAGIKPGFSGGGAGGGTGGGPAPAPGGGSGSGGRTA